MLKMLFIGALVAGGVTIGFGFAGYVVVDGHEYHFSTDDTTTTTPTTTTPSLTPEWQAWCNRYPSATGCPAIPTTTTAPAPTATATPYRSMYPGACRPTTPPTLVATTAPESDPCQRSQVPAWCYTPEETP